jgi:adenylate cyclase
LTIKKWAALDKPSGEAIRQGYLLNDERRSIWARIKADKAFITIKGTGESSRSRSEYEYEIPLQDGEELLKDFTNTGTEKIRYRFAAGRFTWEVDVFGGANAGLIVAEIELKNENDPFGHPEWIGKEVTDDERYTNSSLAKNPYNKWGINHKIEDHGKIKANH